MTAEERVEKGRGAAPGGVVRVLGICGSPRKKSAYAALSAALEEAAATDPKVETELVELRGKQVRPCVHCNKCVREGANRCLIFHDDMEPIYQKIYDADALIVASPVYEMNVTAQLAIFFDRFRPLWGLSYNDPYLMVRKVGGAISVGGSRHGGEEMTVNAINNFFFAQGMTVCTGGHGMYTGAMLWNPGDGSGTMDDPAGMENARIMGRKVAVMARVMKEADLCNLTS